MSIGNCSHGRLQPCWYPLEEQHSKASAIQDGPGMCQELPYSREANKERHSAGPHTHQKEEMCWRYEGKGPPWLQSTWNGGVQEGRRRVEIKLTALDLRRTDFNLFKHLTRKASWNYWTLERREAQESLLICNGS